MYCSETVGWIKIPLGTEVGLGPGRIMIDEDPTSPRIGAQQPPTFRPTMLCHGRRSQQLLSSGLIAVRIKGQRFNRAVFRRALRNDLLFLPKFQHSIYWSVAIWFRANLCLICRSIPY